MKNSHFITLGLLCFSVATNVVAAQPEWVYLGEAYENAEAYLDENSIKEIDQNNKQFTGRLLYTKKGSESVTEVEAILQCNNKVVELYTLRFYPNLEAKGKPTKVEQYEIPVFFPLGNSEGDKNTYKIVCPTESLTTI